MYMIVLYQVCTHEQMYIKVNTEIFLRIHTCRIKNKVTFS